MATEQEFKNTMDSLKGKHATIAALVSLYEGAEASSWLMGLGLEGIAWPAVAAALRSRKLAEFHLGEWDGQICLEPARGWVLTDYGRAFVEWMQKPRELPQTIPMFED